MTSHDKVAIKNGSVGDGGKRDISQLSVSKETYVCSRVHQGKCRASGGIVRSRPDEEVPASCTRLSVEFCEKRAPKSPLKEEKQTLSSINERALRLSFDQDEIHEILRADFVRSALR